MRTLNHLAHGWTWGPGGVLERTRRFIARFAGKQRWYCVRRCLAWICVGVLAAGCSPHNMWNVKTRVEAKPLTKAQYPPYAGKVFLTQSGLPKSMLDERIAQLYVGTVTTQPAESTLLLLADRARQKGANAVFKVKVWQQGSGFSWKAPQASGIAVRLVNTNGLAGLSGHLY